MRVTVSDGRQIVGRFMAFDRHLNLVLGDAEEYRLLPPKKGAKGGGGGAGGAPQEARRVLGLVLLRGEEVISLTVEGPPPAEDRAARGGGAAAAGPGVGRPAGRGMPVAVAAPPTAPGAPPPGLGGAARGVGAPSPAMMAPRPPGMMMGGMPPPPMGGPRPMMGGEFVFSSLVRFSERRHARTRTVHAHAHASPPMAEPTGGAANPVKWRLGPGAAKVLSKGESRSPLFRGGGGRAISGDGKKKKPKMHQIFECPRPQTTNPSKHAHLPPLLHPPRTTTGPPPPYGAPPPPYGFAPPPPGGPPRPPGQ
jgi:small nuclear ribonucleoprotein B and B'